MALNAEDLGRELIDYDPGAPDPHFFGTASEMAAALAQGLTVDPVPWPSGLAPVLATPTVAPDSSDPLPKADVVIVTWTAAEARTLSVLMTPGAPLEQWFEYKSNVASFIPKVTGVKAPFNAQNQPRYYHSLGLYYPITLAGKKVICFKSGLHMDYDGPALPLVDLWKQIIAESGAELIITTGTGGAIGADVLLGDVIIAGHAVFDCTTQFKATQVDGKAMNGQAFPTSPLPAGWATPDAALLKPNADQVLKSGLPSHANGLPVFLYPGSGTADPRIVTTDFFAFDTTTNTYKLQGLGNVCEMGDASLGLALTQIQNPPKWAAIRNASDPQIDVQKGENAGGIYMHFGAFTTAASVVAAWSLVCKTYAPAVAFTPAVVTKATFPPLASVSLVRKQQRQAQTDPSHILLQIAASQDFKSQPVAAAAVPAATVSALRGELASVNVDVATSSIDYRRVSYLDETHRLQELYLAQVSNDDAEAFRGTYLYSLGDLVAKAEFVSS